MFFTIIIPVFNRPKEINDLLHSLTKQVYKEFEVIIVEDGSEIPSKEIVESFKSQLSLQYFYIENVGQGFARNFGMQKAKGDYFVLFDSDCIIPSQYLTVLELQIRSRGLDAHGGPDTALFDFSPFQKAMNFSMTSILTTGGIRGKLRNKSTYQARGFNMGLSRVAFHISKGFIDPNKGEDIELSMRLKKLGFKLELIEETFVYHKRKNTLWGFFKQSFAFGRNRINVSRFHEDAVKPVHMIPAAFLIFCITTLLMGFYGNGLFKLNTLIFSIWGILVFIHASVINKSILVGFLAFFTSFGQLNFYGAGLMYEFFKKTIKG